MNWREYRTIKELEVREKHGIRLLYVEAVVDLSRGIYGCDADGKRGEMRTFLTDWSVETIFDLETGGDVTAIYRNDPRIMTAIGEKLIGDNQ